MSSYQRIRAGHWPLALWLKGFGCGTPCCAPGEDAAAKEGAFESEPYLMGAAAIAMAIESVMTTWVWAWPLRS
jgi:hypothetical protein